VVFYCHCIAPGALLVVSARARSKKFVSHPIKKTSGDNMQHDIFSELVNRWPSSIVARSEIRRFTGGLYSGRYIANLDSLGKGPPRITIGRRVAYPIQGLIAWLQKRTKVEGS
jgi:hypothetical protein